jgi:holliday junction DNA helicase RuvA
MQVQPVRVTINYKLQTINSLYLCSMIAFLKGNFVNKTPAAVYVDVNGVGYEVHISLNTYSRIQNLESGTLFTHLMIREDAHTLFGFYDASEKEIFIQLISVSGIGASTARVMLSYMKPEDLVQAIVQGNARLLESIKGIGKKTAERIVLELKDKLGKVVTEVNISAPAGNSLQADALNALIALGINRLAAEQAVSKVMKQQMPGSVEELIKKSLQIL